MASRYERLQAIHTLMTDWIAEDADCYGSIVKTGSIDTLIQDIQELRSYGRSQYWHDACSDAVNCADQAWHLFRFLNFRDNANVYRHTPPEDYTYETRKDYYNALKKALLDTVFVLTRAA